MTKSQPDNNLDGRSAGSAGSSGAGRQALRSATTEPAAVGSAAATGAANGTGSPGAKAGRQLLKRHALADRIFARIGGGLLFLVASSSTLAVIFIIIFIFRSALPFFVSGQDSFPWFDAGRLWQRLGEFFASTSWRPTAEPHSFGALAIFVGSLMVTVGAIAVAVPMGILAAICLSDILPFRLRQYVKPIIEILAAIPSVAYGFFALVILAPLLQSQGGRLLAVAMWAILGPIAAMAVLVITDLIAERFGAAAGVGGGKGLSVAPRSRRRILLRLAIAAVPAAIFALLLWQGHVRLSAMEIASGANALNVSLVLGIMALPTIVSVSEDALYAVGRELREGSYALGATRAETIMRVVLPAARSGILAAVILGVMRAIGETMVVWMASGNAVQVPDGLSYLQPVRTVTATIAAEMGEADHTAGADHYSSLFALALMLLLISLACNLVSQWFVRRGRKAGR